MTPHAIFNDERVRAQARHSWLYVPLLLAAGGPRSIPAVADVLRHSLGPALFLRLVAALRPIVAAAAARAPAYFELLGGNGLYISAGRQETAIDELYARDAPLAMELDEAILVLPFSTRNRLADAARSEEDDQAPLSRRTRNRRRPRDDEQERAEETTILCSEVPDPAGTARPCDTSAAQSRRGAWLCPVLTCPRHVGTPWSSEGGFRYHLRTHLLEPEPPINTVRDAVVAMGMRLCTCNQEILATSRACRVCRQPTAASASQSRSQGRPHGTHDGTEPEPDTPMPSQQSLLPQPLPDTTTLMQANVQSTHYLPRSCRIAVAACLAECFSHVSEGDADSWLPLLAMPKLCLWHPQRGTRQDALGAMIVRRCRLFRDKQYATLWEAVPKRPLNSPSEEKIIAESLVDEDWLPRGLRSAFGTDAMPGPKASARAERLARAGHFSKACSALSAAAVAVPDEATAAGLQALHPVGPLPQVPRTAPAPLEPFTQAKAIRALRSFSRVSGAGPSGLSVGHLLDASTGGGHFLSALARILTLIAGGKVPLTIRPFMFGARLIALHKKSTSGTLGLRPIACGEILRRIAAKLLCALVSGWAKVFFTARQQFGVAVPNGAEAIIHVADEYVAKSSETEGVLKTDWGNAFNAAPRATIIEETEKHFPQLLGYVIAALCVAALLFFGAFIILSLMGVQQGDPLGPLLFALALGIMWRAIVAGIDLSELILAAWFLDDGSFGGHLTVLKSLLLAFSALPDWSLNLSKCEVIGDLAHLEAAGFPPTVILRSKDSWDMLGCPRGNQANVDAGLEKVFARTAKKLDAITSLSAHVAYTMVRTCASYGSAVFFARSGGPSPIFAKFDSKVRETFGWIVSHVADTPWRQAELPTSMGGLGLRPSAPFVSSAFISSICSCIDIAPSIARNVDIKNLASPVLASCPYLANFPAAAVQAAVFLQVGGVKIQKALTKML